MRKIYKVAQREFLEVVRTRTFLLGLVLIPALIVGSILLSHKFLPRKDAPRPPIRLRVAGPAAELTAKIKGVFDDYNQAHPLGAITLDLPDAAAEAQEQSKEELRQERLDVYAVLEGDLEGEGGLVRLFTYKSKPSQADALGTVEHLLREAVIGRRYETHGLDRQTFDRISMVSGAIHVCR